MSIYHNTKTSPLLIAGSGIGLSTDGNVIEITATASGAIFMFANAASDITGYKDAVQLNDFTSGTLGSTAVSCSTTPTIIEEFATESGSPGLTAIPIGNILIHYETEKTAGSNNYYTYVEIYKRNTGGTETLLLTSDNSSQYAVNTKQQITVSAFNTSPITLDATDRLVFKVYGVMLSATATITVYYDNNSNARAEVPVSISPSGGSGTPGGSDTQVQFNDGGSFGGDANFTFNKTTNRLTVDYVAVNDDAYNATTWNANVDVPTKNAIRDKIDTIDTSIVQAKSTGVITGGAISIGTGGAGVATTFTVASGTGQIVDNTVSPNTVTSVSWSTQTDVAVTNILTNLVTFVAIDSGGNVIQSTTDFTPAQMRQYIVIGVVVHSNQTTVNAVNQTQIVAYNQGNQLTDLFYSLGLFNISGNVFSPNGANMKINKSAGSLFRRGANYTTLTNNPHVISTGALTQASLRMQNQTGAGSASTTDVDVANYDVGGTTTAISPATRFSILRVFLFQSNLIAIQRGQTTYLSLAEAKAAIQTETYVTNDILLANGLLRGFIVAQANATSLSDANKVFFIEAGKFGGSSGVGGLSVSTLQNAYNNSSDPEILTDSTRGAVSIKRGSAADTDSVLEVLNGAGSTVATITGEGNVTVADEAYGAGWNGSMEVPTKNAVYDEIETKQDTLTAANVGDFVVALTGKSTPVDGDSLLLSDSAASDDAKKLTWANLKATLASVMTTECYTGGLQVITNQPNTERTLNNSDSNVRQIDATNFNYIAISCRIGTASTSGNTPRYYPQYSTDGGVNYTTIGSGTGTEIIDITNTGLLKTSWITLPAGAKGFYVFRIAENGGDGAADPSYASSQIHFKT